jgi:hypothetical protein
VTVSYVTGTRSARIAGLPVEQLAKMLLAELVRLSERIIDPKRADTLRGPIDHRPIGIARHDRSMGLPQRPTCQSIGFDRGSDWVPTSALA